MLLLLTYVPNCRFHLIVHNSTLDIILNVIIALGSIGVMLLAVYGQNIRRWLFKPSIEVVFKPEKPFIEQIKSTSESQNGATTERTCIRIKVVNTGKETAFGCTAITDCIYEQDATHEKYIKLDDFVSLAYNWTPEYKSNSDRDSGVYLLQKVVTYINIAEISVDPAPKNQNAGYGTQKSLKLNLENNDMNGKYYPVNKKNILFPVKLFANNMKTIVVYVKIICHDPNSDITNEANFNCTVISESDGLKMLKERR